MTKNELQSALAEATAGVFLDTLGSPTKRLKGTANFSSHMGFNPKTQQKIKIPAKPVVKFRIAKAAKDAVLGVKK